MRRHWLGQTYIEDESLAYNTSSGAHSRSNRHGRVRYPDGRILSVTLGVPDTSFTIPAHGRLHGKYVSGYVSVDTDTNDGTGEYVFQPFVRERLVQLTIKSHTSKCSMCGQKMYQYHVTVQPTPDDLDCGGNCWKCQRDIESDYDEAGVYASYGLEYTP